MTFVEHDAGEHATRAIEEKLRDDVRPRLLRPLAPKPEPVVEQQPSEPEPEPLPEPIKIDHTMLPVDALEEVSRALMYGKEKHGAWGWVENPKSHTELLAKVQRHIFEFQRGVTIDPTTKLSHIACAICDLMFLQSNILKDRGTDDRFKY
jgi:dATP/dGTP diphosphohydrolase